MRIVSYNCGHDASTVLLEDGRLTFCLESEKDDELRHLWAIPPQLFLRSLEIADFPDVVAISGFHRRRVVHTAGVVDIHRDCEESGYMDESAKGKLAREMQFVGRRVHRFSSSHVRSHVMCSYGLSPFPQGQPCYMLLWEGRIGAFYFIDEQVNITKVGDVVDQPGMRFCFPYVLANPNGHGPEDPAGKFMALAAFGTRGPRSEKQRAFIKQIFSVDPWSALSRKEIYAGHPYFNIGVESQDLKDIAWHLSEEIFDRFYQFAKANLKPGLPLLIGGGCGLNCDWNSKWRQCGLFSDVFVPPCPNDSGVSLGAAIDAQHHYTKNAKVEWDVYCGDPFVEDQVEVPDFERAPLDLSAVCRDLGNGDVIAWAQGKFEMGPRALGNRSLLAHPFTHASRDKLNRIKQREGYRPIAPICLEDEFGRHFENHGTSPHMLYFQRVLSKDLAGVTHVDGSARAQTVNDAQNPAICALLREFRAQTGFGVLCNTSLNFKGHGFINRSSHLFLYARERELDGVVVGDHYYRRRAALQNSPTNSDSADSISRSVA